MSENRRRHVKAMYAFDAVVQRVPTHAWDNPSPCAGWKARNVLSHLAYILPLWIGRPAPEGDEIELANEHPATVWNEALGEHLAHVDSEADLLTVVSTNMGPLPMDTSLGILMVDPLVHAWDLAQATGTSVHLPEDLCIVAYETLSFARDAIGNMFEPKSTGPAANIQEKMLRMAGRNPAWPELGV